MVAIILIFVCMPKKATKDGKISKYRFLKLQSYYNNNLKYCSLKYKLLDIFIYHSNFAKNVIASFQVINFSCLNKLFKKMHSVFAKYFSKLRNDKFVHNYRPCMINRTILIIILLRNCIFISKQRTAFRFQTEDIK